MMDNLDEVRAKAERSVERPRWPGDPLPAALVEHLVTQAAQGNAWQKVADLAQQQANAARAGLRVTDGKNVLRAVAEAQALAEPARGAHSRYRWAEEYARPPLPEVAD